MPNRIIDACRERGSYALSEGTMEPAIVLERLMEALAVLDADAHQRLMSNDGSRAAIPLPALFDENHRWWRTDIALQLVEDVVRAIDAATLPHGFICGFTTGDRLVLEKIDAALGDKVADPTDAPPPSMTMLRARVQSGS